MASRTVTVSTPPRSFFAGVDGGGSATRVIIASPDGDLCSQGSAAGSNPAHYGPIVARQRLQEAFAAAWLAAGLTPQPLAGAFFGIAGLNAFRAQSRIEALSDGLIEMRFDAKQEWDHDLRIALAGGLSSREGIVVIAGTGSSSYGRNQAGETWQAGGWGALLDDVGGGYWLGLEALKHICRAHDGRGEKTSLTESVRAATGTASPAEILQWIRIAADARAEIAGLAPLVLRACDEGDAVATRLVNAGANELGQMALAVAAKLFDQRPVDVVFTGGLAQDSGYFGNVRDRLAEKSVALTLRRSEQGPLVGALLLAMQLSQVPPSPALLEKLRQRSGQLEN